MNIDREEIKRKYSLAADEAISALNILSSDIWGSKSATELKNEVDNQINRLKTAFREALLLKDELLKVKNEEIPIENETERQNLKELTEVWQGYESALSVVFFGERSPFIFSWSPDEKNWEKGILGLKTKPPIASKEFIKTVQGFLEIWKKEVNEN